MDHSVISLKSTFSSKESQKKPSTQIFRPLLHPEAPFCRIPSQYNFSFVRLVVIYFSRGILKFSAKRRRNFLEINACEIFFENFLSFKQFLFGRGPELDSGA